MATSPSTYPEQEEQVLDGTDTSESGTFTPQTEYQSARLLTPSELSSLWEETEPSQVPQASLFPEEVVAIPRPEKQPDVIERLTIHEYDVKLVRRIFQAQKDIHSYDESVRLEAQVSLAKIDELRFTPRESLARSIHRVVGLYKHLFQPCIKNFLNTKRQLEGYQEVRPELVVNAKAYFVEHMAQILTEPLTGCTCTTAEEQRAFVEARGQFVSNDCKALDWPPIIKTALDSADVRDIEQYWQSYPDIIEKVITEMLDED